MSENAPSSEDTPDDVAAEDAASESFDATVLDEEDTAQSYTDAKPWDPSKIRITTKTFSLREVVDQIKDNEIDLAPDFQRDFVWKARQRTRLVESILLGIPLPAFYFNQDREGTYQVVDGVQRLSTVSAFMNDQHVLHQEDLAYLRDLDGLNYSRLDPAALRRFRSTQIVVHVIEPQTPDDVKYDIFSRVNTLGSPLSAQEIRHAMSKSRSREFLKELTEIQGFDEATGFHYWRRPKPGEEPIRDSGRMTNRELALRFCAFRFYDDADYRQHTSLDAFLVEYTRRLDRVSERSPGVSDHELETLRADFHRAMANAHDILGKAAFRRWPPTQTKRGPINRAVFEAQAIALSSYELGQLIPKRENVVSAFRALFANPEYARAVTVGTGDPKAVERRLHLTKLALAESLK